ncbi:hypothetical protein G6M26_27245 [Agrobacterium tumefaciens]|nr:hypothetical protein [Agrobacterium tumefaciens]NTE22251.1 hypothetical protein [Agrobacterium tumefaciens]
MEKTITLAIILFLQLAVSHAQLKVGSMTDAPSMSSILEVESANRGFLPPRISLTSNTMSLNGSTPTNGMVVFNTNSSSGIMGLCIWRNGRWNKLVDSENQGIPSSHVLLKQTSAQALPTGTTNLIWHAVVSSQVPAGDSPMWANGSDIVIRRAGIYCFTADASMNTVSWPGPFAEKYLFISRNGVQITASSFYADGDRYLQLSGMIYCNVDDVIRFGYVNGGASMVSAPNTVRCGVAQIPTTTFE